MSEHTDMIELVKEYIPDSRYRIKLDELVTGEIRQYLQRVTVEHFPVEALGFSPEEFSRRLHQYGLEVKDLQTITVLLSYWGSNELRLVLRKIIARISEHDIRNGVSDWLELCWYPSLLLLYSGGIAAISSNQYTNLATLLATHVQSTNRFQKLQPIVISVYKSIYALEGRFRALPGHDREHVPISEYLFEGLRTTLEDMLFLGNSYEPMFDRFEVLFALVYVDLKNQDNHVSGPLGRFAWKHRDRDNSPFVEIVEEAKSQGQNWLPLRAGLFSGSYERFQTIAQKYGEFLSLRMRW